MGLHLRDVSLLLLSLLGIFLSFQQEGDLQLTGAFFQTIDESGGNGGWKNGQAPDPTEKLPLPVITDIDGDGKNEVLITTRAPSLKILRLNPKQTTTIGSSSSSSHFEWESLDQISEVSLLQNLVVKTGRQPVALATGYIHPYSDTENRKQIIVVVTESWNILCFDHSLKLLWSHTVEIDLSTHYLSEVAIHIDTHAIHEHDTGMVIVGGRLAPKKDFSAYHLHYQKRNDESTSQEFGSPVASQHPDGHLDTAQDTPHAEQEDLLHDNSHFDRVAHFSFYAFHAINGETRWTHDSSSFIEESHAADILRPQHDVQSGEVDWRNFRSAVIKSLPHQWRNREDTQLTVAHYERKRIGHDRQKHKKQKKKKSALHTPDLQFNLRPHSDIEHIRNPNALVAHVRDGIEVLHLYTGRPVSRISLSKNQIHVDCNHDGVIDHIEVVGQIHKPFGKKLVTENNVPKCLAMVTSGVPQHHTLYNGSICDGDWNSVMKFNIQQNRVQQRGGFGSMFGATFDTMSEDNLKYAHPTVLPEPHTHRRKYQSFFFINTGLITSFNHDGSRSWKTSTKSNWLLSDTTDNTERAIALRSFYPTITPFSLYDSTVSDHLIVVGETQITLINQYGTIRSDTVIRDIVVSKPVQGDLNNDGINDIIIVTNRGYYGYIVERRLGGQLFSILIMILFILLMLTFAMKLSGGLAPSVRGEPDAWKRMQQQQLRAQKSMKAQL